MCILYFILLLSPPASCSLGAAWVSIDQSTNYLKERSQFGQKLAEFQVQQQQQQQPFIVHTWDNEGRWNTVVCRTLQINNNNVCNATEPQIFLKKKINKRNLSLSLHFSFSLSLSPSLPAPQVHTSRHGCWPPLLQTDGAECRKVSWLRPQPRPPALCHGQACCHGDMLWHHQQSPTAARWLWLPEGLPRPAVHEGYKSAHHSGG